MIYVMQSHIFIFIMRSHFYERFDISKEMRDNQINKWTARLVIKLMNKK